MRELSLTELFNATKMAAKIGEKILAHPEIDVRARLGDLAQYLQDSENKLIALMNNQHPSEYDPGSTQYGLVLYYIDDHHPLLQRLLGLPPSRVTPALLLQWTAEIEGAGVADYDGSLIATGVFEQLDPGWVFAVIYYAALILDVTEVTSWATFGTTPATIPAGGNTVRLALVGDWGTGAWEDGAIQYPALQVIDQVKSFGPDYTIHLGDVYYAGTSGFFGSDEEMANFIALWAPGSQGTFMLNSNHEMYNGAQGYFGKGLTAGTFAGQQGTSYFCIEGDKWIIFGLDTAYYDRSSLFMNGALTDANQISFIRSFDLANKKVIVITHHNGTSTDGTTPNSLWTDVTSALGRAPDFWYWGHIHNGIVYSAQSAAGQAGTNARCSGHGAIPFAVAYGLVRPDGSNLGSISYFAHELMSSEYGSTDPKQANRVLNGFAQLTISAEAIKEEFYDQTGILRWSQTTAL